MKSILRTLMIGLVCLGMVPVAYPQGEMPFGVANYHRVGGKAYATAYNTWVGKVITGNTTTGSGTSVTFVVGPLADGTLLSPSVFTNSIGSGYTPIFINDGNAEVISTITAETVGVCPAGNLGIGASGYCVTITGTTTGTHGQSAIVQSGTGGLQEAINDLFQQGASGGLGGIVVIDSAWHQYVNSLPSQVPDTVIGALTPYANVSIEDDRRGSPRYWNLTPTGLALAAPTLPAAVIAGQLACDSTHQSCSDASVVGSASWGGAVYLAIAYVDIAGNEGPPSATTNWTSAASKAIDIGAPAASTGAVGWIPYLSLSGGTYAQAYQLPVTSALCTLTTLETVTPACALDNTTYGQTRSSFGAAGLFTRGGAQFTGYPLNTSQHFTQLASTVQTTAALTPMTNSSVTYSYAPSSRIAACPGMSSWNQTQEIAAGGTSASSTTGIPMAMGTWTVPANCFNYVGAEFRVSGKITWTDGGASDAMKIIVAWDAPLSDSTTLPLTLCNIANTHTNAGAAQTAWYSCTVRVLTTGATGTAMVNGGGFFDIATGAAGVLIGGANDTAVAQTGATMNLTVPARIAVRFSDTGATVTGAQPLEGTLEVLN